MRVIGIASVSGEAPEPTAPDVPQNLRLVSLTSEEAVLAWDTVEGADSYELYRDDVEFDGAATSPATDDTVVAETTYVYRVRAVNEVGASDFSNSLIVEVPEAALPVPDAPVLELQARAFDFITFRWEPVLGAVEYEVYDGMTLLDTIVATEFTHSGLTAESSHSYTVIASNASGDSDPSDALVVDTLANLPPVWDVVPAQSLSTGQAVDFSLRNFCVDPEERELTFTVGGSLDANVRNINSVAVTGGSGTPWGRT